MATCHHVKRGKKEKTAAPQSVLAFLTQMNSWTEPTTSLHSQFLYNTPNVVSDFPIGQAGGVYVIKVLMQNQEALETYNSLVFWF